MVQSKVWFLINDGQVSGPFDPEEVEAKLPSAKDPQIWGRGQSEWMTPAKWRISLKEVTHVAPSTAETQGLWRLRIEGQEKSPLKYTDLINLLKSMNDFSAVDIRPDDNSPWKEVYAIPRVVEDLGITRRSHPRVPMIGTLNCEGPQGPFTCRVISISEGGLGVNDAKNLKIGDTFDSVLTSPNLYVTINCPCEVVYVGSDGYAGLRFVRLPEEFKSSIIEYVKKFAI